VSDDLEQELHKQFKASQEKYMYFLLAVLLWALSVVSGLKLMELSIGFTFKNMKYLSFKRELKGTKIHDEYVAQFKESLE
jgi:hypothetical protein